MLSQACVECRSVESVGCPIRCQLPLRCRSADTFRRQVSVARYHVGLPTPHTMFGALHKCWCTVRYEKKWGKRGISLSPHQVHPLSAPQSVKSSSPHHRPLVSFRFKAHSFLLCICVAQLCPTMAHIPALPLDRDSRRPEKVLHVVEFCCTLVTDHGWEPAAIEAHLETYVT